MSTPAPFSIHMDASGPHAGVAVFHLEPNVGPMVVLDDGLIQRLEATLRELPRNAIGLVMASASPRVFVAGADLKTIAELSDADLARYLAFGQRVFGMLADLPYPTAAAIHGAALGGGLEVAMHCDALIASPPAPTIKDGQTIPPKPYPVGLPEAGLCICPGWGGTNLLPARIDPERAIRATCTGSTFTFDEAKALGLFDAVATSKETLLDTAKAWVRDRTKSNPGSASLDRDGAPSRWIGRGACAAKVLAAVDAVRRDPAFDPQGPTATDSTKAVLEAINAGLSGGIGGSSGWRSALAVELRQLVRLRSLPAGKTAIEKFFAR